MKLVYVLIVFMLMAVAAMAETPAMTTPSITYYTWGGGTYPFPTVTASNQWVVIAATGSSAVLAPAPSVTDTLTHATTKFTLINSKATGNYCNVSIWAAQVTIDSTHALSLDSMYVWVVDVCTGVQTVKKASGSSGGVDNRSAGSAVSYKITVPSDGSYYPLAFVGLFNFNNSSAPTTRTGYALSGSASDSGTLWTNGELSTSLTSTNLPISFSFACSSAWASCACVIK